MPLVTGVVGADRALPIVFLSLGNLTGLKYDEAIAVIDDLPPGIECLSLPIQTENMMMNRAVNRPCVDAREGIIRGGAFIEVEASIFEQSRVHDGLVQLDRVDPFRLIGSQEGGRDVPEIAADVQNMLASVHVGKYLSNLAAVALFVALGIGCIKRSFRIELGADLDRHFRLSLWFQGHLEKSNIRLQIPL
jgi:hypothetical protein